MVEKRFNLLLWHRLLILLVASMLVLAVALASATWYSLDQASKNIGEEGKVILSEQIENSLSKLVEGQADTLDLQLGQAKAAATYGKTFLRENTSDSTLYSEQLEVLLPALLERTSYSSKAYFVTKSGEFEIYPPLEAAVALPQGFNLTEEPFFPVPAEFEKQDDEVAWSQVHFNPLVVESELVVDAITPVVVDGVTRGYIGISISLNQLISQFNQRQLVPGSYSFLIDSERQLVAAPPHARVDLSPPDALVGQGVIDLSNTGNDDLDTILQNMVLGWASLSEVVLKGEPKYVAYQPLANIDWRLGVVVPIPVATAAASNLIEVVEASSQQALAGMLVGTGIVLLIAMVAGGLLTRQLIAPLREMVPVTESIAAGDLERRIAISQLDEIGTLARAFNTMTDQLQTLITGLEDRVADRTQRLEIVATLGEHLGAILHLEELLPEIVDQVKENFGYYHAHIYLLDEQRENLVVAAGTGEAGAEMKARGHSIAFESPTSLVARAARTGQIVRVDNVRETEDWLPNPLLPDTYSEMAVPVVLDGQVVGVLDVQEDKIAGLDESDASLLRSLANQVAVTIRNAHQFEEVETALAEAHTLQRQYVQQAWDRTRVTQRGISRVQYSLGGPTTLPETVISEVRQQLLSKKQLTVVTVNDGDQEKDSEQVGGNVQQAVVAPVNLHGTTIGNLQLHETDRGRKWTEGELAIVNAVVEQVAQVAENLRLFSETQERASRERLIGEVSDKLRRAPDMETLVQRAVSELAQILGPARAFVRFGSQAEFGVAPEKVSSDSSESPQPAYIEEDLPETDVTPANGRELKVDGNGRNGV